MYTDIQNIQSNYQVYTYSFRHIVFWANQSFHWETSETNTSVQDSRKLPSYPSHKPTFTPTSNLRQIVGLGVGYMGSFQSLALTNLIKPTFGFLGFGRSKSNRQLKKKIEHPWIVYNAVEYHNRSREILKNVHRK